MQHDQVSRIQGGPSSVVEERDDDDIEAESKAVRDGNGGASGALALLVWRAWDVSEARS